MTSDILSTLNPMQTEAVRTTDGPLLILAGAGSGKTRVIVHRIAYLIGQCGVDPRQILAITFTNKAADEMRERVDRMVRDGAREIWVMTFHSFCVRVLRRHAEEVGLTRYFSIYDTDDSVSLMKEILHRRNIDPKQMREKSVLHTISNAKDRLVTPSQFKKAAAGDYRLSVIADLYAEYQTRLKENNAADFDDLINETVRLFTEHPEILALYQDRFRYLMVDEYQDTNTAQFELVRLMAGRDRNLCVVGDDDQSIYKFRGANIRNILDFEEHFPDARVVSLEQNYRSTGHILDAANGVIANNRGRKQKTLWTDAGDGEKVRLRVFRNGFEEAEFVTGEIAQSVRNGECDYGDCAVLYRTNAQSRLFEEKMLMANIPYRIVGGVNFYSRKEIKDLLAYLKTIDNAVDDLAVKRIINIPKRGIGATSVEKLDRYATENGISFFEAAQSSKGREFTGRSAGKIADFVSFLAGLREESESLPVSGILQAVIDRTGYVKELELEDTDEASARIENIDELISKAVLYEETAEDPSLSAFLAEVALVADIDSVEEGDDRVLLMTMHSAKGLEFERVYLAGMEDGLFPSYLSLESEDTDELEEERRLCYVGITRAKRRLTLTCAKERMVRGDIMINRISRFVEEIPEELLDKSQEEEMSAYAPKRGFDEMRKAFRAKPYTAPAEKTQDFGAELGGTLSYEVGDTVLHSRFGIGRVLQIVGGGRDFEVTVDFDGNVKKMFASFAKLTKAEESDEEG